MRNRDDTPAPDLIDRALTRAAEAPLIHGNAVRLLRDATENYPAWLNAIAGAERYIYFESYIIRDDDAGRRFAEALMRKAGEGVTVHLIYDWLGAVGKTPKRFWNQLRNANVQVRCFNPPRLSSPLGWLQRDHRKTLSVDGRVAFVSGLCVGDQWTGDPNQGIDPWRDTGLELRGPAVAAIEQAFRQMWAASGAPIPAREWQAAQPAASQGDTSVRVIATEPWTGRNVRLDQLVAAAAREKLWLSDAYFAGTPVYMRALQVAVRDGVDVRLLVPGGTDIPVLRPLSQAGYRPLLESGVRVFEWNGPMMHAKTGIADDRMCRVGSTNLNLSSWLGNWELDVAVEDAAFTRSMTEMYLADLDQATELVLHTPGPGRTRSAARRPASASGSGSAGRVTAGAMRVGNAASAALTNHRLLGPAEAKLLALCGALLIAVAVVSLLWPRVLMIPLAAFVGWAGIALLARAHALRRARRTSGQRPKKVRALARAAAAAD
jgi:cardiolipin synthase